MKILFKSGISLIFLFVLFRYIEIEDFVKNLRLFSITIIIYGIILFIISWVILVYRWKILLPYISFTKLMSTSFIGYFYSIILPGQIAGEIVKAYRLGKGRGDAELIAASVVVDKLIGFLGLLVISLIGLMASHAYIPVEIPWGIGFCTLLIFIGLICLKIPIIFLLISGFINKLSRRWPSLDHYFLRVFKLLNAWESYLANPLKLIYAFLLALVFQLIFVKIIILFSQELGIDIPFTDWCWTFGLVSIAVLLPISLGGIGVREGAFAGALSLQGVPLEKSIALSIAIFSISLLAALTGGLLDLFSDKSSKGNR